jgi:hypothetical protein
LADAYLLVQEPLDAPDIAWSRARDKDFAALQDMADRNPNLSSDGCRVVFVDYLCGKAPLSTKLGSPVSGETAFPKECAMSIFDTLKAAIFGPQPQVKPGPTAEASQSSTRAAPAAGPAAPATAVSTAAQGSPPSSGSTAAGQVDIEAVLNGMAARRPEKLNWQSSIVDLMKLVDLDPSLSNRKALAGELGYAGDTQDSAKMNIWLHQQVMQKLAAAGGKVPDSLRH